MGLLSFSGNSQADSNLSQSLEAAISLKKNHVTRSYESCMALVGDDGKCKKLLQLEHKREQKVFERFQSALAHPEINQDRFFTEFNACYNPNSDYTNLIDCWVLLADRLDAAMTGQTLLTLKDDKQHK